MNDEEKCQDTPYPTLNDYCSYFPVRKSQNDKNEYMYKVLRNGLKCLIIYDKEADKSAAALTVNVGSLCDPEEYMGLAHFLEHMLFMGTSKYPNENDFSDFLSKNSGDSNAYTGLDTTQYYFDVKNESFAEALDRFAQFFLQPLFNKSAVEREMKAVESEHKKNTRSDSNRFLEVFRSESMMNSPFRKFQTGNTQTLKQPDIRKVLKKFHSTFYSSNLMNLCVMSNIPLHKLETMVDLLFNDIKTKNTTVESVRQNYTPNGLYPYIKEDNLTWFYKLKNVKDRNSLSFYWIINENLSTLYRCDPLEYITSILHHEGKGSLYYSLSREGLITDLECSYEVVAQTYTQLYVHLHLTEKGFTEYNSIIARVVHFVQRIQSLPINKDYFDEIQKMTKVDFDFFEKAEPVDFCSEVSENMSVFKPEDVLSGAYLIEEYSEELIRKYLDMLRLDNMNIYFASNKFEFVDASVERWYGTKYTKRRFDLNHIPAENYFSNYTYPSKNRFIPSNFELKSFDKQLLAQEYPQVILTEENKFRIWYKADNKFKIPKVYISAQIYLPSNPMGDLPVNSHPEVDWARFEVYLGLWRDVTYDELKETVYSASLARIEFALYNSKMGLVFELAGFNDTLLLFADDIMRQFVFISDPRNIENFKSKLLTKIEDRLRMERNSFKSSANAQVSNKLNSFLHQPHVGIERSIEILERLKLSVEASLEEAPATLHCDYSKFLFFLQTYFSRAYFEWLVQGNIQPSEASEAVQMVMNILNKPGMKLIETNQIRVVKLPEDTSFYHIFESSDTENENSAILSYFQVGYLSDKDACLLELIEQILYDKFFDELRTKQALGYLVSLSHRYTRKVEGIVCLVQSNVQSPEFIFAKINDFFDRYNLTDEDNIPDKDFASYVDSLITSLKQKDLTLADEVYSYFAEIQNREYEFDRDKKKIKIFENEITKKDVVDFYEEHFIKNVKRIDVEMVSAGHSTENRKLLLQNLDKLNDDEEKTYFPRQEIKNENVLKRICELYPDFYYYIKK